MAGAKTCRKALSERQKEKMSRIQKAFENKKGIYCIYQRRSVPDKTEGIHSEMEWAGADLIEIGIPFSDPIRGGDAGHSEADIRALSGGV